MGNATSIGYFGQGINGSPINTPYYGTSIVNTWGWIDVDTAGVMGRVDDIFNAQVLSGDGNAEFYFRISIDGAKFFSPTEAASRSANLLAVLYPSTVVGAHYPWAIAIVKI